MGSLQELRQSAHEIWADPVTVISDAPGCRRAAVAAILRTNESHGGLECLYITRRARAPCALARQDARMTINLR